MISPPFDGLQAHASLLQALVSASPDHFYLYDRGGRHLYVSPVVAQALGIAQESFVGKTWHELGFPSEATERFDLERETVFQHDTHWQGELVLPTELGQPSVTHDYVMSPVHADDGTITAVLVSARNIAERKAVEAALQHQALHDVSTGLANRALLNDRLEQSLLTARRSNRPLAVLFLDLNDFKAVNDTIGHHGGDLLLQELAQRWTAVLRGSDTLARIGGDEFVVLLPETDAAGADETAVRLRTALNQPFDIEGYELHIGVSLGIALHRGGSGDAKTLMRRADAEMYHAKRQRRSNMTYLG